MSNLTLIIGNKNYSSWSLRPWILMRHFEMNFHEKRVALFEDTTRDLLTHYDSDFKVPVLQDGESVIWDSLSILEYVSEQFLDGKGWPEDIKARAFARSVSCEMHSSFFNVRGEMPMNCRKKVDHFELSDKALKEVERISSLWRKCRNQFGENGPYLFGEFSIADAMFAPVVLRFNSYAVKLQGVESDYMQTILNHPGINEWMEAGRKETEVIAEDEV